MEKWLAAHVISFITWFCFGHYWKCYAMLIMKFQLICVTTHPPLSPTQPKHKCKNERPNYLLNVLETVWVMNMGGGVLVCHRPFWNDQSETFRSQDYDYNRSDNLCYHSENWLWNAEICKKIVKNRLHLHQQYFFRCLGSTQHLKGKFGQGYILEIKLPGEQESQESDDESGERLDSSESPLEVFIKEVKIKCLFSYEWCME